MHRRTSERFYRVCSAVHFGSGLAGFWAVLDGHLGHGAASRRGEAWGGSGPQRPARRWRDAALAPLPAPSARDRVRGALANRMVYWLRRSSPIWLAQNDPEIRVLMKYPG